MSKFCVNCGAELEDNAGFCGACGSKQEAPAAPVAPAAAAPQAPVSQSTEAAASGDGSPIGAMSEKISQMSPEQKKKIGIIAGVAAAVIILIIVIVAVVSSLTKYQKIDCKELYYVSYSGINGQATANVFLATASNISSYENNLYNLYEQSEYYEDYYDYEDYEKFLDSLTSKWLKTDTKDMKKAWTKFDSKSDMQKAQKKLIEEVEFKVDKDDLKDLSNGDTIKVKVKYNEKKLKNKNIKLENTEFTITVEGLLEPEVLDPLSKVKVSFSGNDGRGSADIDTSELTDVENSAFYIYFDGYYYSDLSNGDTVTVVASPYYSLSGGYFSMDGNYYTYDENALSKEFKVEGLKELDTLDPFEGLELTYSDKAPELRASVNTDNCPQAVKECISFELDKSRGISIGDTITVTATVKSWYEDTLAEYGYSTNLSSTTKTFTVDNSAPHYINDISEATTIDTDTIFENVINKINESAGKAYLADVRVIDYGKGEIAQIKSVTADDAYLVAPSDAASSSNVFYQIFKVETTCTIDGASTDKTFYVMAAADSAYVENGSLAYDDWYIMIYASESKDDLIKEYVKNDSNQVDGKKITTTAAGAAQAPVAADPADDEQPADATAEEPETTDEEAA